MRSSKEFLLLECESVRSVLQETLRYEYGGEGSREFFEECEIRLDFTKLQIAALLPEDHDALENNAAILIELSELITRIERSSLGEYSWPFVDNLKEIAVAICTEATLTNPHTPPKVHVLSDGGLNKYAINVEQKRPWVTKRRILTIIFPRSLKHFVLLHPVLGHELGHAIWRGSEHEAAIKKIVTEKLLQTNVKMASEVAAANWLYSPDAPDGVKKILQFLASKGIVQSTFFVSYASWSAWVEEIACDLIGLATFGPSFVAALCQLLHCLVSSGNGFGDQHPPVGCRINIMLSASRLLGYDKMLLAGTENQKKMTAFWENLNVQKKDNPWFDIFSDQELLSTITDIRGFLANYQPACFETPDVLLLENLITQLENQIPPVGNDLQTDGKPICPIVDFRHILYAGWIAAQNNSGISFYDMNRLCEHALMQQRAIKIFGSSP